jgi:hypothetical protein
MEVASIPQGHYGQAMADICGSNKSEDLKRKQAGCSKLAAKVQRAGWWQWLHLTAMVSLSSHT